MQKQPPFQPEPGDPQGNIQPFAQAPLQGAWTGDLKPVRLNHLYKGGKLCDLPMYNKATDIDPTPKTGNKTTVVQMNTRSR
jgi:hypothetical protein